MTTMDAAAARRLHPRVALAVIMAMAGFGLAGCETSNTLFGSSNAPTTVEPVAANSKPVQTQPAIAKVAVAPIIGAPDATARQIQEEFTSAIEKQRVSVVTSRDDRVDYTLRGYIVAAKDKNGTKVSYIWDVTDPTGKRVNRITGEEIVPGHSSKDPWAAITPQVAQSITAKAASSFVAWVGTNSSTGAVAGSGLPVGVGANQIAAESNRAPRAATKQSSASGPQTSNTATTTASIGREEKVAVLVPLVTGAPGDGSKALASAIQRELSVKGVALTDRASPAAYRVEGSVVMGQAADGKQSIQIEWLVRDPAGKKLGSVAQKNEIPAGSLDGTWGKIADQAASAATQGIVKLLPTSGRAVN